MTEQERQATLLLGRLLRNETITCPNTCLERNSIIDIVASLLQL